jgi:hypothetical protein
LFTSFSLIYGIWEGMNMIPVCIFHEALCSLSRFLLFLAIVSNSSSICSLSLKESLFMVRTYLEAMSIEILAFNIVFLLTYEVTHAHST